MQRVSEDEADPLQSHLPPLHLSTGQKRELKDNWNNFGLIKASLRTILCRLLAPQFFLNSVYFPPAALDVSPPAVSLWPGSSFILLGVVEKRGQKLKQRNWFILKIIAIIFYFIKSVICGHWDNGCPTYLTLFSVVKEQNKSVFLSWCQDFTHHVLRSVQTPGVFEIGTFCPRCTGRFRWQK